MTRLLQMRLVWRMFQFSSLCHIFPFFVHFIISLVCVTHVWVSLPIHITKKHCWNFVTGVCLQSKRPFFSRVVFLDIFPLSGLSSIHPFGKAHRLTIPPYNLTTYCWHLMALHEFRKDDFKPLPCFTEDAMQGLEDRFNIALNDLSYYLVKSRRGEMGGFFLQLLCLSAGVSVALLSWCLLNFKAILNPRGS